MSNNTGLGIRQAPSEEVATGVHYKFHPSHDINFTVDGYIFYFEAYSVTLLHPKGYLFVLYIGCPR